MLDIIAMNSVGFTTGTSAKTFLAVTAARPCDIVVDISFAGIVSTDPQVLVEVFRFPSAGISWSAGNNVTPLLLDSTQNEATTVLWSLAKENASSPVSEPSYSSALRVGATYVHPQSKWISPRVFRLDTGESLSIRCTVATAVVGLAEFWARSN